MNHFLENMQKLAMARPKFKPKPNYGKNLHKTPDFPGFSNELYTKHFHLNNAVAEGHITPAQAATVRSSSASQDTFKKMVDEARPGILKKEAKSFELTKLIEAKAMSDKKDYTAKNRLLKEVMVKSPKQFKIDSKLNDKYVGITHKPSGFRIHAPRTLIPTSVEQKSFLKTAEEDDTIFDVINNHNLYYSL